MLLACNRPIMQNELLFSGNDISLISRAQHVGKSYSVAFRKDIFVPTDPSKTCINYPSTKFKSYKDCDDAFIYNAYKHYKHLDPVWVSGFHDKNTSAKSFIPNYNKSIFINMFNGVTQSDCPRPCSTVRVISRLVRTWKKYEDYSLIDIAPSSSVLEARTDFVKPTISAFLSEFGGAMGLWLGLGMVQVVQTSWTIFRRYVYGGK